VRPFLEEKWGRRRDDSTVSKADDTMKSDMTVEEAKDNIWRSKMTKEN
jgi:hypothetical protein